MRALSIKQPWAWLIVAGLKDIENRDWPTRFRGRFLIHASRWEGRDRFAMEALQAGLHPVTMEPTDIALPPLQAGGIIGEAELLDCVTASASPWFVGRHGFVIGGAQRAAFRPLRGHLGFFEVPA